MQEETVQPSQDNDNALQKQLDEAKAALEQQRDGMLRAVAEAENARKRALAEAATGQKFAVERFAQSLLPVLDSLEAAIANRDATPQAILEGVELTLRQFLGALEKARVSVIDPAAGERFDPHRHQAMAAVESAAPPNTVVSTMQKGYALHDRVLRPALVTVAKAVEKDDANPISSTQLD